MEDILKKLTQNIDYLVMAKDYLNANYPDKETFTKEEVEEIMAGTFAGTQDFIKRCLNEI